jgi:Ca2+-transporting ATPase
VSRASVAGWTVAAAICTFTASLARHPSPSTDDRAGLRTEGAVTLLAHAYDFADFRSNPAPHARDAADVLAGLRTSEDDGLDTAEAERRLVRCGPNAVAAPRRASAVLLLLHQLRSPVVYLLALAAGLALAFGERVEAGAIGAVLVVNTAIGFATEIRAARSIEALRTLGGRTARVRRDGRTVPMPAEALVPGDIVLVEAGDLVAADLRLIEASNLGADESLLTGESVPTDKSIEPAPADAPLGERRPMLFKGTAVTRGTGLGVVVGTGMETELGRISQLVAEAEPARSPLERRLAQLAGQLVWATVALTVLLAATGFATGQEPLLMAEAAISLAVAAIPEGLPVVATLALARGVWRMARQNALVERLSAVETLGATTVILTDKTGTLTETG